MSEVKQLPHHETFVSFEAAVKEGCYICSRVREDPANEEGGGANFGDEMRARNPFSMYSVMLFDRPDPHAWVNIYLGRMNTNFLWYPSKSTSICE